MCKQLFLFLIFYFPLLVNAQNLHIIRPDGSVKPMQEGEILPSQKVKLVERPAKRNLSQLPTDAEGLIDTIYQHDFGWGTNVRFGFSGHDMMIQWFETPANLTIISVGINVYDPGLYPIYYDIKLVKSNWNRDELINSGVNRWGYYYEHGNSYNDAAPLISELSGNTDTVWIAIDSSNTTPIWDEDLCDVEIQVSLPFPTPTPYWFWGIPYPVVPMVGQGDIFGVVIYNTWPIMNDGFIRILASTDSIPYGGFKYYADGRYNPGVDFGWWSREYAWDMAVVVDILSDMEYSDNLNPITYALNQNYPNPFNPLTKIEYSIPKTAKVEIIVFDILGREVVKLVNETKKAGKHEVSFDGSKYASGLYFYRIAIHSDKIKAGKFIQTRKMLLMK